MAEPARSRQAFFGRLAQLPRERALAEIARNLGFVLNTRKACGSVLPEFGLGDYEREVNTQRAVDALRAELLAAVRRYEPRIAGPSVRLLGRHHANLVRFEIAGLAEGRPCALAVDIDTGTRRVEVHVAGGAR